MNTDWQWHSLTLTLHTYYAGWSYQKCPHLALAFDAVLVLVLTNMPAIALFCTSATAGAVPDAYSIPAYSHVQSNCDHQDSAFSDTLCLSILLVLASTVVKCWMD